MTDFEKSIPILGNAKIAAYVLVLTIRCYAFLYFGFNPNLMTDLDLMRVDALVGYRISIFVSIFISRSCEENKVVDGA